MSDIRYTHDDPPWKDQRLPDRWWDDREYRLEYMVWLGEILGYSTQEDWYEVSVKDFEDNDGGNPGYRQGMFYRVTAPVLDPTSRCTATPSEFPWDS